MGGGGGQGGRSGGDSRSESDRSMLRCHIGQRHHYECELTAKDFHEPNK